MSDLNTVTDYEAVPVHSELGTYWVVVGVNAYGGTVTESDPVDERTARRNADYLATR